MAVRPALWSFLCTYCLFTTFASVASFLLLFLLIRLHLTLIKDNLFSSQTIKNVSHGRCDSDIVPSSSNPKSNIIPALTINLCYSNERYNSLRWGPAGLGGGTRDLFAICSPLALCLLPSPRDLHFEYVDNIIGSSECSASPSTKRTISRGTSSSVIQSEQNPEGEALPAASDPISHTQNQNLVFLLKSLNEPPTQIILQVHCGVVSTHWPGALLTALDLG